MKQLYLLITLAATVLLLPSLVSAFETPPHNVYGYVTEMNTDETIEGAEVRFGEGEDGVITTTNDDGWYDVNIENFDDGQEVKIYVNGIEVDETITFESGSSEELSISVDLDYEEDDEEEDDDDGENGNGATSPSPSPSDPVEDEPDEVKEVDAELANGYYLADIGEVFEEQLIRIDVSDALVQEITFKTNIDETDVSLRYRNLGLDLPQDLHEPEGYTYSYFSTSLRGIDTEDIYDASIEFNVDEYWINRITEDPENVALLRYSDDWDSIATNMIGEGNYYTYRSSVPAFSVFSVVSDEAKEQFADISVNNFKVSSNKGNKPLEVTAEITLENIGTQAGSEEFRIYLNDEILQTESFELDAGEMKTEELIFTIEEAGEHTLQVDGIERGVTVQEDAFLLSPFVLILIVVVMAVVLGTSFVLLKSGKSEESDYQLDKWKSRQILHNISNLNRNLRTYMDEDVVLRNVRVEPIEQGDGGWWHKIKDNTGEIYGFSKNKVKDCGNVEGFLKEQEGRAYIMF